MVFTQVLNQGGRGLADEQARPADERYTETAYHAARDETTKQPTTTISLGKRNRCALGRTFAAYR